MGSDQGFETANETRGYPHQNASIIQGDRKFVQFFDHLQNHPAAKSMCARFSEDRGAGVWESIPDCAPLDVPIDCF
jgi:hypothetical protein